MTESEKLEEGLTVNQTKPKGDARWVLSLLFLVLVVYGLLAFAVSKAAPPNPLPWDTDYYSWIAPTVCADGSALPNCVVIGYDIQTSATVSGPWTVAGSVASNVLEFIKTAVAVGPHCYRAIANSTAGAGPPANALCSTTVRPQVPPGPPVSVTIDTVAYKLDLGYANQIKVAQIGTVPLGLACKPNMYAMGLNVLSDRSKVTLTPGTTSRPLTTLGKCG